MFLTQVLFSCCLLYSVLGYQDETLANSQSSCCPDEFNELKEIHKTLQAILEAVYRIAGPPTTTVPPPEPTTKAPPPEPTTKAPPPEPTSVTTSSPPSPVLDISVECGSGNVAINNAIGQTFFPTRSGTIDKIAIWIKQLTYYTTEYKLQVFKGPPLSGSNLLGESNNLNLPGNGASKFYDFTFPSSIALTASTEYSWKLIRLSRYSGAFSPCSDQIPGVGYWLAQHPNSREDYSFKLYILA